MGLTSIVISQFTAHCLFRLTFLFDLNLYILCMCYSQCTELTCCLQQYLAKKVCVLFTSSTIENEDFTIPSSPITFSAGGRSTFQFDIMIDDDSDFEGDHSFSISFVGDPFVNMGTIPEAIVVITDFDGKSSAQM